MPDAQDFDASFLLSLSHATLAEIALRRGAIDTAHEHVRRCDLLPPLPRVFVLSTTLGWVRARVRVPREPAPEPRWLPFPTCTTISVGTRRCC